MGRHSEQKTTKTKRPSSEKKHKKHSSSTKKKNVDKHHHNQKGHSSSALRNSLSDADRKILKQLQNANLLPSNHFQPDKKSSKKNSSKRSNANNIGDQCDLCGRGSGCGGGSGCCRRRGIRRLDDGTSTLFNRWLAGSIYGYIAPTPAPVPDLFTMTLLTVADCPGVFYELAPVAPNTIADIDLAFGFDQKTPKKGATVAIGNLVAPNDVFNSLYELTGLPSTDSETYILKALFPFSGGCKALMANDFLQIKYGPSAGIYSIESLTTASPPTWVLSDTFVLDIVLARPMVTCKPTTDVGVEYGVDFSESRDCASSSSSSCDDSSSSSSCESSLSTLCSSSSSESWSSISCSSSSSSSCESLSTLCSSSSSSCPFNSSFGESSSCSSNSGKRRHRRSHSH